MTDEEKLERLKTILQDDETPDNVLSEYLDISAAEILNWLYIRKGSVPVTVTAVPAQFEQIQIMAVVEAVNIVGAEGQSLHIENGVHRQFKYDDLVAYIHSHVPPYVVVA